MTASRRKRARRDDGTETFALYVAFHSAWTAVLNLFKDD